MAGNAIVGGSDNVILGYNADVGASSNNNIVIGKEATGSTSNEIILGNSDHTKFTVTGIGATFERSGATIVGVVTATSFVGDGSALTGISGSGGVTVQDEGSTLSTQASTLNFVGSGVVASGSGATKTITISGGGSGSGISTISGVVNIANDLDVDGHTNLDNVSVAGVTTFTGAANFGSNLELLSSGINSLINETGSGNLYIKAEDVVFNNQAGNQFYAEIDSTGLIINESVRHANDTDTLFGFPGDNTFAVQTNNVERIRVANQNIYIAGNETGNNRAVVYNYSNGIGIYASPSTNHRQISLHSNGSTTILNANQAGVNITGICTATSFVGDGSNLTGIDAGVGITTNLSGTFTASAGSPSTINTFVYGSGDIVVEYTIFIKNGSDFQTQKLLAMRDGTCLLYTSDAADE